MSFLKDTQTHINHVNNTMNIFARECQLRGKHHDYSKLSDEEYSVFTDVLDNSKTAEFGTPEYDEVKRKLQPALEHHYKENRHHPEHFIDGVAGMNLIDLLEMLADWSDAAHRHERDNILKSVEFNSKKYNISEPLKTILINTINDFHL